jgi:hypothetical protein
MVSVLLLVLCVLCVCVCVGWCLYKRVGGVYVQQATRCFSLVVGVRGEERIKCVALRLLPPPPSLLVARRAACVWVSLYLCMHAEVGINRGQNESTRRRIF